jgi:hypothetical protein
VTRGGAYAAVVWALWAVACLLFGLVLPLAWWLTSALLRWPAPVAAEWVWLLTSGVAFVATAPWVRAQLRRDN